MHGLYTSLKSVDPDYLLVADIMSFPSYNDLLVENLSFFAVCTHHRSLVPSLRKGCFPVTYI